MTSTRQTAARVLIPGAFLDAWRADPPAAAPEALRAILACAQTTGQDNHRRAALDVPAALLAPLAETAYELFAVWGADRRTFDARAAFHVYAQARRCAR